MVEKLRFLFRRSMRYGRRGRMDVAIGGAGAVDVAAGEQIRVTLHVLAQMIRAHETVKADRTDELLFTGVCAKVTREFVGARERLVTRLPLAHVRPFACVHTNVRFEMRALEISLHEQTNQLVY